MMLTDEQVNKRYEILDLNNITETSDFIDDVLATLRHVQAENERLNRDLEAIRTLDTGKVYRHFKGNPYRVLGVAFHTETGEMLTLYTRDDIKAEPWARPYEMFHGRKECGTKRFEALATEGDTNV